MRIVSIAVLAGGFAFATSLPSETRGEQVPVEYREAISNGLDWLAGNQHKDGHWEALGNQYPVAMTSLAGMAMLMEGSTIRDGKYHINIRRAVDWLMTCSHPNGLIVDENHASNGQLGYMYDHGFAMLFLSSIVGEEEDADRRRKLVDILERAARFSRNAQSSRGGWFYIAASESEKMGWERDADEGSVTVTQLQSLRAARNAGIVVPVEAIKDGIKYLGNATNTNSDGGVRYRVRDQSEGRPVLTAAAIVCGFSAGEYNSPLVKSWFKFCRSHLRGIFHGSRLGHDEYTNYYWAQAIYMLGEDGWGKLFPEDREILQWSSFRKAMFDTLLRNQQSDGSWNGGPAGPVFDTSLFLSILQLDKAVLPIYQR